MQIGGTAMQSSKITEEYSTVLQLSDLRITVNFGDIPESDDAAAYTNVHSHALFEMLISVGGIELTVFQGETIIIPPGAICLIPPGVYHSTRGITNGISKHALSFIYERTENADDGESLYLPLHSYLADSKKPIVLEDAKANELYALLAECYDALAAGVRYAMADVRLRLGSVFIGLLRLLDAQGICAASKEQTMHEELRRVKIDLWLHLNFRNHVTVGDLAAHLNVSVRQMTRILEEIYACGFRELLIDQRMHTAAELLAMTELPAEEIAYQVGYSSLSGFYSAFRQFFGVSAIRYRKNSHNIHENSDKKTPSAVI